MASREKIRKGPTILTGRYKKRATPGAEEEDKANRNSLQGSCED